MYDLNICEQIINHLQSKKENEDTLDGIMLSLFPNEVSKIAKNILSNISYLIEEKVVEEYKNGTGKRKFVFSGKDFRQK